MQILSVNNITKNFGFGRLFSDVSFSLNEGETISIVGPNGCGKSTLLKMIAGIEKADQGQISIKKNAKVSYLDQTGASKNDDRKIYDILRESFGILYELDISIKLIEKKMIDNPENQEIINKYCKQISRFNELGGYEMEANLNTVINGLKLDEKILNQPYNNLSGGERALIQLAKILISKPDLLLLDEPTNHLDIARIEWLENYIKSFKGAIVIVSHDRYFLDKMCSMILDLETKTGELYSTNYSGFLLEKNKRIEKQLAIYKDQQLLLKKLEADRKMFAERGMATNSSTLTARAHALQTRIERLKKNAIEKPVKKIKNNIEIKEESKTSNRVISITNYSIFLPDGKALIDDINLEIFAGERIALLGSNGCGKSTLVKSIIGKNDLAFTGEIKIGPSVKFGYIPQIITFPSDKDTLLDYFKKVTGLPEQRARQVLFGFNFYNDDVKKRVGNLSGGERMKIKLAELLQNKVNTLILDEPTNHIDIESKEIFESALEDFSGTILFVSHDRFFINEFADKIIAFDNKKIKTCWGNYNDYLKKVQNHD